MPHRARLADRRRRARRWRRLTGREPFATVDGVRMSTKKMFFNSARAIDELGYAPRPARQAIADAVAWFKANGYLQMTALSPTDSAAPRAGAASRRPSGKERGDENFPVGSWLIRRDLRAHVHAFYRFARNADDIADNPALAADEKIAPARPHGGDPGRRAAATIRRPPRRCAHSLAETGVTAQHCHDVLHAFRQDAIKLRYRDWDDLMDYCRYSAVAGRPAAARSARREPRHLAGLRCAVRRAAGAQPPAGLRRRLPRLDRVYLPLDDLGGGRLHGRGADGAGGQPGAAPRARPAARPHRSADRDRAGPAAAASRRAACAGNRRSSSRWPGGWRAGCGAAIRWPAGSS